MKVIYEKSMRFKALQRINELNTKSILRKDLEDLGSPRQISRAFIALVEDKVLVKIGYGVYGKLAVSKYSDEPYLDGAFLPVAREALTRLEVEWDLSEAEKDYNERKTTQVPANPATKLKSRFNRVLSYQGRKLRFE